MRPRSGTLASGIADGEAEIEAEWVSAVAPLAAIPVGAAGGVETVEDMVDVLTSVELIEVAEAAGTGTVMSKGGLYSKVPVRSSIILMPYLLPAGIFAESSKVLGTAHVYAPEFAVFASER